MKLFGTILKVAAVGLSITLAGGVSAAVIGSFDSSRGFAPSVYGLGGSAMTRINDAVSNNGHTTTTTAQITDSFLSGVDVFFAPTFIDSSSDQLSGAEQTSLANWVSGGGILFALSENSAFDARSAPTFSPFGVTTSAIGTSGATWNTDADPLVAGLTGSTGASASGSFTGDVGTVLAKDSNGNILAFVKDFGQGKVIGFADVNAWTSTDPAESETFAARVFALGDGNNVPAVPVPAALPLLVASLGCFGALRFRRRGQKPTT